MVAAGRGRSVIEVQIPDKTRPKKPNGRYPSITKRFKLGEKELAQQWLTREVAYLEDCVLKGVPYVSVAERQKKRQALSVTFSEFATQWVDNYRDAKGDPIRPYSMRAKRVRVRHLVDFFTTVKDDELLADITAQDCRECRDWLEQFGPVVRANTMTVLNTILKKAARPIEGERLAAVLTILGYPYRHPEIEDGMICISADDWELTAYVALASKRERDRLLRSAEQASNRQADKAIRCQQDREVAEDILIQKAARTIYRKMLRDHKAGKREGISRSEARNCLNGRYRSQRMHVDDALDFLGKEGAIIRIPDHKRWRLAEPIKSEQFVFGD